MWWFLNVSHPELCKQVFFVWWTAVSHVHHLVSFVLPSRYDYVFTPLSNNQTNLQKKITCLLRFRLHLRQHTTLLSGARLCSAHVTLHSIFSAVSHVRFPQWFLNMPKYRPRSATTSTKSVVNCVTCRQNATPWCKCPRGSSSTFSLTVTSQPRVVQCPRLVISWIQHFQQ